jgi:hypothetical protein
MKKPLRAALVGVGGLVLSLALIGIATGSSGGKPAGSASPVVTLTAPPTHAHSVTSTPGVSALRASPGPTPASTSTGPKKPVAAAAAASRAPASPPAPPPTSAPPAHQPVVQGPTASAQPTPPACTPVTQRGKCYEPGEFCRKIDHGASGVAGDGQPITCENNNGWRWEPS